MLHVNFNVGYSSVCAVQRGNKWLGIEPSKRLLEYIPKYVATVLCQMELNDVKESNFFGRFFKGILEFQDLFPSLKNLCSFFLTKN